MPMQTGKSSAVARQDAKKCSISANSGYPLKGQGPPFINNNASSITAAPLRRIRLEARSRDQQNAEKHSCGHSSGESNCETTRFSMGPSPVEEGCKTGFSQP